MKTAETTMKAKNLSLSIFLVLLVSLVLTTSTSPGTQRDNLRGLEEIGVEICDEYIDQTVKESGLTKEQILTDVEVRLRKAEIEVLAEAERLRVSEVTILYVLVHTFRTSQGFYVVTISVELKEWMKLTRNKFELYATTWEAVYMIEIPQNKFQSIMQKLDELIDMFISDYLPVNPKGCGKENVSWLLRLD